jgi:hypothetical protein
MDLPITDEELNTIIKAMSLGGDASLYHKLKLIKELKDQGLPYKKNSKRKIRSGCMMKNLIQVKYYFKEHPKTALSIYLKTQEQVEAFKTKHPDYVYITENN